MHTTNLNFAECLRESHNWGVTKVYNVCDGTFHSVPWGGMDYIMPVFGVAVLTGFAVMTLALVTSVTKEIYDYYF